MPVIKFQLDQQSYELLVQVAVRQWRPTVMQAEVLLKKAIAEASHEGEVSTCPDGQESRDGVGVE